MKAARMHEYGKALVLEDVPVPDIKPDEVLVQVRACGNVPFRCATRRWILPEIR